jgi:hypothetical protein
MIRSFFWTAAVAALLGLTQAVQLATLEGRLQFPDGTPFNVTSLVTLNHGDLSTYSKIDGTFQLTSVPPGIHLLEVQSIEYHFGQVKIQLLKDAMTEPKCVEYMYPGAPKKPIGHPLELVAYATYEYYEKRPAFSFLVILKNPMFLMMAFSVGMMVMMPKMMEGLDPEEKAKLKEQMANQQDPTKMLSSMFEGITGGEEAKPKKIKN